MNIKDYIKFISEGFMPVVMEQTGTLINTPYGKAQLYSLAHYYEQNGDLMHDPEIVFIVVDNRKDEKDYDSIGIYPQLFQQDTLGVYEESVCIENNAVTTYKPAWQEAHATFANQWLRNIQQQGFKIIFSAERRRYKNRHTLKRKSEKINKVVWKIYRQ